MNILIIGDVVGSAGRAVLNGNLARLKTKLKVDFAIVQWRERSTWLWHHRCDLRAPCISRAQIVSLPATTLFDQRDVIDQMGRDDKILRPINYPPGTPGRGYKVYTTENGKRIMVANVMCRLFMGNCSMILSKRRRTY